MEDSATRALGHLVELEGSSTAVAHALHVPDGTLKLWLSGRAQMPVRAFLHTLELLLTHESNGRAMQQRLAATELKFLIAGYAATCSRCDAQNFRPENPDRPLSYGSVLVCCQCGKTATHSTLLAALAGYVAFDSKTPLQAKNRQRR